MARIRLVQGEAAPNDEEAYAPAKPSAAGHKPEASFRWLLLALGVVPPLPPATPMGID